MRLRAVGRRCEGGEICPHLLEGHGEVGRAELARLLHGDAVVAWRGGPEEEPALRRSATESDDGEQHREQHRRGSCLCGRTVCYSADNLREAHALEHAWRVVGGTWYRGQVYRKAPGNQSEQGECKQGERSRRPRGRTGHAKQRRELGGTEAGGAGSTRVQSAGVTVGGRRRLYCTAGDASEGRGQPPVTRGEANKVSRAPERLGWRCMHYAGTG